MALIDAFDGHLYPGNEDPTNPNHYSFFWHAHASPKTPLLPAIHDSSHTQPRRYLRTDDGTTYWGGLSLRQDVNPARSMRMWNFHVIGGYPGWVGGLPSALALDLYATNELLRDGSRSTQPLWHLDVEGGGTYNPSTDTFSGVTGHEFLRPWTAGERIDVVMKMRFNQGSTKGLIAVWVNKVVWVPEQTIDLGYPGYSGIDGGKNYVSVWIGAYQARLVAQEAEVPGIWITADRYSTISMDDMLTDVPTSPDYWTSQSVSGSGQPASYGIPAASGKFNTALFLAPDLGGGGTAPTVTAIPTIAGTKSSGSTLTLTPGTYTGSPTLTRQWHRSFDGKRWTPTGNTSTTYAQTSADIGYVFKVIETATNAFGSVTTETLVTFPTDDGAGNYVALGNMETTTLLYGNQSATTVALDTSQFHGGTKSLKITVPGAAGYEGGYYALSRGIYVEAGWRRTASVWMKGTTGTKVRVALNSFDTNDARVGVAATVNTCNGAWQLVSVVGAAPPNSVYQQISFTSGSDVAAWTVNFDDLLLIDSTAASSVTYTPGSVEFGGTAIATETFAYTCNALDKLLLVPVAYDTASRAPTSVTYNGVALTRLAQKNNIQPCIDLWYLVNPATGASHNVVVTYGGTVAGEAFAESYQGVDTAAPFGTVQTGSGNNAAPTAAAALAGNANDMFFMCTSFGENGGVGATPGSGWTSRNDTRRWTGTFGVHAAAATAPGALSKLASYALTGTSAQPWTLISVPIKAAGVAAPTNTTPPTIIGTAQNTHTLSAVDGVWTGGPSLQYQWLLETGVGTGVYADVLLTDPRANLSFFVLQDSDVGLRVKLRVTAINETGSASVTTAATSAVTDVAPTIVLPPQISGPLVKGSLLSSVTGVWAHTPTSFSLQWLNNGVAIPSATFDTYLVPDDIGDTDIISLRVTAHGGGGDSVPVTSNTLGPFADRPDIQPETAYSDIELDFIENEPPGMFVSDQVSMWGQTRKVFADHLQVLADLFTRWYRNADPSTVDVNDLHNWENMLGIPVVETNSVDTRRAFVEARRERGPFTKTRRANAVESFIRPTLGTALSLTTDGLTLDAGGLSLYADTEDMSLLYAVVEDVPNFTYTVRIKDTISPDTVGLTRELTRMTPDGITFSIVSVPTP